MKLRVGKKLAERLRSARDWYGFSASECLRRADRRAKGKEPRRLPPENTSGGTVVTLPTDQVAGRSEDQLRERLAWLFDDCGFRAPRNRFRTDLKAGRDYVVES